MLYTFILSKKGSLTICPLQKDTSTRREGGEGKRAGKGEEKGRRELARACTLETGPRKEEGREEGEGSRQEKGEGGS